MALDQAITTGNSTEKPAATDETCIVSQKHLDKFSSNRESQTIAVTVVW